jgi:predicted TIM-barrel fold metal-dependent hydrolase
MVGVIDSHVHLSHSPDDILIHYAQMNGLSYDLKELLRLMKKSGVSRGILLSPPLATGSPASNEDTIQLCLESHGILSPALTVVPTARGVAGAIGQAKTHDKVVKGFKVLLGYYKVFANDPVFERLYNFAEARELPIMFHTGDTASSDGSLAHSHPLTLDALANERPKLRIVACHFGNPWIRDVGELLYKHENFFADISGLAVGGGKYSEKYGESLAKTLSEAIYYAGGSEKVIFGSDYPVTTYPTALKLVAKLEITESEKTNILGENAKRVFDI